MASSIRVFISFLRMILTVLCILDNPLKYLNEIAFQVLISVILLLYLGTGAIAIIEHIDSVDSLYFNILNICCYYSILLLHVLFCIKIHKSSVLQDFIDAKFSSSLYFIQLFLHLISLVCSILMFIDLPFAYVKTAATLSFCGLETLTIVYIILKKLSRSR